MTRINIIPVTELLDQHLGAEYVETLMLCSNLIRTLSSKHGFVPSKVPNKYTLNKGHVYFFFNKGLYLHRRFNQIRAELKRRGRKTDFEFPIEVWPDELYNDWTPSKREQSVIRKRIAQKVSIKPYWYKYYGRPVTQVQLKEITRHDDTQANRDKRN